MRPIWMTLGFLLCGLGIIGMFLPVLPTVPFILLAAFFFSKGSDRFHRWFTATKFYKKNLESYAQSRSMRLRTKIRILCTSTPIVLFTMYTSGNLYLQLSLAAIMAYKYYYFFFRIKTMASSPAE